jgi:hypothetical protein
MEMLAEGAVGRAEAIFDNFRITATEADFAHLSATAERAVPKLAHRMRWALPPGSAGLQLVAESAELAAQRQAETLQSLPPRQTRAEASTDTAEPRHLPKQCVPFCNVTPSSVFSDLPPSPAGSC